jgi:hypothetical protein
MFLFPEEWKIGERLVDKIRGRDELEYFSSYEQRYGENLAETIRQLREEDPKKAAEIVQQIVQDYNSSLDEAITQFPLTVNEYWQGYRRTRYKSSLTEFCDDKKMAEDCKRCLATILQALGRETPTDSEPAYELLGTRPSFVSGIEVYCFNKEGEKIETLWDLRQKQVPKLKYNP